MSTEAVLVFAVTFCFNCRKFFQIVVSKGRQLVRLFVCLFVRLFFVCLFKTFSNTLVENGRHKVKIEFEDIEENLSFFFKINFIFAFIYTRLLS